MTPIIVILLLFSYLLIATTHLTGVNKAAISIFLAAIGWVVYISWGTDYIMDLHSVAYSEYLGENASTSDMVKNFIYDNVFLNYVGKAAAIVMYLLATMSIIEILNTNGCFDFINQWIRTRNSNRLLWTITLATFVLSANIDNLTTTIVMLIMMHSIVRSRAQRMLIGSAVVLAAVCGGCFTVIGDPTGLLLWGNEAVTATDFSSYLALPALVAWIVPTLLIGRQLPSRLDVDWGTAPFRGDDTRLNRWQRMLMLIVGLGGLWFIPTFLSITRLPAFLGALVVLSLLWVVNEAFNRKFMDADQMSQRRIPRVIQYEAIQQVLFVMGIMLGLGVVAETGVFTDVADWMDATIGDIWLIGIISGIFSSLVDSFTIAASGISLYDIWSAGDYAQNGLYWKVIAYCTAVGGCLLSVGSVCGLALMKMEHIHFGWYFKNVSFKVLLGWLLGLAILWAESLFFS
jgi:Na+/H+ antiporter NhaD/arsenite permease-like protein